MPEYTPDTLSALAGALLSVIFTYAPKLKDKYAAKQPNEKSLIMLALIAAVSLLLFGAGCLGWLDKVGLPAIACTQAAGWALLRSFLAVLIGNQTAFLISPKPAPSGPWIARPRIIDEGEGDGYTPR